MGVTWKWAFFFVIFSSGIVFLFSLWLIINEKQGLHIAYVLYVCLFISTIILFLLHRFSKSSVDNLVRTFEKTLKGGLFHFQCPHCQGIFAVKESMNSDKKAVIMTCPDCGGLARIPQMSRVIKTVIPQKKSENVKFQCQRCGESLKIWAEGANLYPMLKVFSCPFCGSDKPLKRI